MQQLLDKWERLRTSEYLRPDEKLMLNHCISDLKRFMDHSVEVNKMVGNRTAVEWLVEKLESSLINTTGDYKVKLIIGLSDIEQAKEIEKERMIEFANNCIKQIEVSDTCELLMVESPKDLYNKTYGGGEQ
jgi:hypothetical protein